MNFASFTRILYYLVIFTIIPWDFVYGWGPLTHIAFASEVLKVLSVFSFPVIEKILRYKNEFIFGNVYADVILAKNLVEYREHSHNWKNGLKIFKRAETPEEKSFAYGYLCHLASDCIAHNYYIPRYLVLSYNKIFMKHTYWEMRYDNIFHESTWRTALKLPFILKKRYERILQETLVKPLFNFSTHKNIFNGILFLQGIKQWRTAVEKNSRKNGFHISEEDRELFHKLSLKLILDLLENQDKSLAFSLDPTGRSNILKALHIRKIIRKNGMSQKEVLTLAKKFLPEIRIA